MSYYDDRHYYPPRDRYARSSHHGGMDVVPGGRTSSDSLDYPPPPSDYGYGYGYPPPRQSRRPQRSGSASEYYGDWDGYDDAYYQRKPRHHRHHQRHERREPRYSSPSTSRSPPPRARSRGRHHRSYSESPSPTRSRSRPHARHSRRSKSEDKMAQAVRAAITAGAIEAFRVRKEPGEWTGEKGKRILTAAVTAGGADGLVDKDPRKHEKRHIIESTLAGLATNHFVNGPRSRSRSRHHGHGSSSHGREKSSSGHGKELAAAGLVAAAGKKAYDRYRSKSRPRGGSDRGRSSSRDGDDYDSDGGSPRRSRGSKRRSKSVSDYISHGLSALGLEEGKGRDSDHEHRPRHRRHRDHDHGRSHRRSRYSDEDSDSGSSGGESDDSRRPRRGHGRDYR